MRVQIKRLVWSVLILAAPLIGAAVIALLWVVEFPYTYPDGKEYRSIGLLDVQTDKYYPGKGAWENGRFKGTWGPIGMNPVGVFASLALSVLTVILVASAILMSVVGLIRSFRSSKGGVPKEASVEYRAGGPGDILNH